MDGILEKCPAGADEGRTEGRSQLRESKRKGGDARSPWESLQVRGGVPDVHPTQQGSWELVLHVPHARVGDRGCLDT